MNKQCTEARNLHPFLRENQEGSRTLLCQELAATCSRATHAIPSFLSNLMSKHHFLSTSDLKSLVEQKDKYVGVLTIVGGSAASLPTTKVVDLFGLKASSDVAQPSNLGPNC